VSFAEQEKFPEVKVTAFAPVEDPEPPVELPVATVPAGRDPSSALSNQVPEVVKSPKSFTLLSLLSGAGCAGINLLDMMALVYIPSSICYPLMSTVSITSVFLLSLLYYKEGHSKFGYIMLVFSLVGILSFSFA
jgi:multidrug transporter EmrE-like cation transporter